MTQRIMLVVGARPQFVKVAPILWAIDDASDFDPILVHTGQHFDLEMSDVFFSELGIVSPKHNLGIHGGGHGEMTGRMMQSLEPVVEAERPDWMVVFGDTNSTLAAALVASKLNLRVAHIEAGLRSFNRRMPEELNRVITDHVSTLLFCPTRAAVSNLSKEGITEGVHHVGDVMLDCIMGLKERGVSTQVLERLGVVPGSYSLVTIHRAENVDDPEQLDNIISFLETESKTQTLVWPLHPRLRPQVDHMRKRLSRIIFCEPLGYLEMFELIQNCSEVFTDSGGLQKEAFFHGKLCTTLRSETEWIETVETGWNRLWYGARKEPQDALTEYGDGSTSRKILDLLAVST
jgi:UDP-GlcNAc3NAcA epimerase